jgi:hypothetical protein
MASARSKNASITFSRLRVAYVSSEGAKDPR